MSQFSFGTDPEFMLMKGDQYVSAIPVIKADRENAIKKNGHEFYWDNVLAECAIKPAYSKEEAVENISECLKLYSDIVAPTKLVIQASHLYPKSAMKDKGAMIAGCALDNCVYSMRLMEGDLSPKDQIASSTFRTCGGHIHLGQEEGILVEGGSEPVFAIYLMDLFLGVPSIFMDLDKSAPRRRTLYGQAGRFRNKPYGFEYRSLSSFWLASPVLVELVYDICNFIMELLEDEQDIVQLNEDLYWDLLSDGQPAGDALQFVDLDKNTVKKCIDDSDKKTAKTFLNYIESKLPANLYQRLNKQMAKRKPYNLYKEWSL